LISHCNVDLVVTKKILHNGKNLTPGTFINGLINEGSRIVIFRTGMIEISIINVNMDNALFFCHRDNSGHPIYKRDGIDEPNFEKFFNFTLDSSGPPRVHWVDLLANRLRMWISGYFVHNNARINARNFFIGA